MTHSDPADLTPELLGLYVDEAIGRAGAIVAALTVRAAPDDADIAWALEAAHSLKGLTLQAGDVGLAEEVHDIESAIDGLRAAVDRAGAAVAVADRLRVVERALEGRAGPGVTRDVDLTAIADAARDEALRVAAGRGVRVAVEVVVPAGLRISRRTGGVLVDVLGHIARNAVTHGTPTGGTVRLTFEAGADTLSIVVADHGAVDRTTVNITRRPNLSSGRGVGLRAAQGRLAALGGELSVSPGPWGGTSVTVRIPR